MLLLGANLLRGETPSDESFATHLTSIQQQLPMLPAGAAMPESGGWAAWLQKDRAEEQEGEEGAVWWAEYSTDDAHKDDLSEPTWSSNSRRPLHWPSVWYLVVLPCVLLVTL